MIHVHEADRYRSARVATKKVDVEGFEPSTSCNLQPTVQSRRATTVPNARYAGARVQSIDLGDGVQKLPWPFTHKEILLRCGNGFALRERFEIATKDKLTLTRGRHMYASVKRIHE